MIINAAFGRGLPGRINLETSGYGKCVSDGARAYIFKIGAGIAAVKAAHFDGEKLVFENDFPDPEPGESLVRVTLAGICGTDLEILDGYMDYRGILGHEFVGVVEKSRNAGLAGKRVVGEINVGCGGCGSCRGGLERHCPDRSVLGILRRNGAFAELLSLPDRNLHAIPDSVSDQQAVFVEPLAAAFEISEQVQLQPDWRVAVVGDGRLAQLIARVLRLSCRDLACFGRHQAKLARLERIGIRTSIGISPDDGHSFDLVVEATGGHSGFSDAARLVRPRGTIVLKSTLASKESLDLTPAVVNEVTLVGSRCGVFGPAIEALAAGTVSVDDLVDATHPLEDIHEAVEHAREPGSLKVLVRP